MKKIIAAFDGLKYSPATTEYAVHIAKQSHAHLVGIFLDDMIYHSFRFTDVIENDKVSDKKLKKLNEKLDERLKNIFTSSSSIYMSNVRQKIFHYQNRVFHDFLM